MMVPMEIALVICLVAAVAALTWLVARRGRGGRHRRVAPSDQPGERSDGGDQADDECDLHGQDRKSVV